MKNKICFLVSGNGGTFKFLLAAIKEMHLPYEITSVFADRECSALEFAKAKKIKNQQLSFTNNDWDFIIDYVIDNAIDIVVTNIHKIVPGYVIEKLPNMFLNLHYSLLPSFKGCIGMRTVDLAREKKVKIIGGTAHLIDENIDEGTIITQGAILVEWNREITDIYNDVFQISCLTFLNALIILLKTNTLKEKNILFKYNYLFSPNLQFDTNIFNETFWKKII